MRVNHRYVDFAHLVWYHDSERRKTMDQIKIGKFIADCRKKKNMTQMQLAEALNITDRAVSKWENGRSMPDSAIMLPLCGILGISVNDLLHGEVIQMEEYNKKTEELLLASVIEKEEADKKMLLLEWVIGSLSVIILLGFICIAAFIPMEVWLQILLAVSGFVIGVIGIGFAVRIEQTAGYYECARCHHKYVPRYGSVLMAMHMGRTRYMKCPNCGKRSWQKKRISKD